MHLFFLAFAALYSETGFQSPQPAGWTAWSPRAEIMPKTFVDSKIGLKGSGALAVSGVSNAAAYGGWRRVVPGIEAGRWYQLTAHFRTSAIPHERTQVVARLNWLDEAGKPVGWPEYAADITAQGEWKKANISAPAPPRATAARLELYLANAPLGTLWWDGISLAPVEAPAKRQITIATVNLRPRNTQSAANSVEAFYTLVDREVTGKADVILLPEGITVVGTGKTYVDVAESVPGPTTQRLGELARRKNSYIVAGIYEREGNTVYNTAVLIDRKGEVAGKYRKVYLPREEYESGLTPGSDYPVFRTDFGRVGMMICYDVMFPDPARALALGGADLVLLPIWGGETNLGRARAIENRVWLVSSGYDYPSQIQDPIGETLAVAGKDGSIAFATVDLNQRYVQPYLGEWRSRIRREMRFDVPVDRAAQ